MNHGTQYAYVTKWCRCDECREWLRQRNAAARARRKARAAADPSIVPHGAKHAYRDFGCRCDACVVANREENRRQRGSQPMKSWTPEQVAEALHIYATVGAQAACDAADASAATVRRWAKAAGVKCYRPPLVHGTRSAYSHRGCRCAECVEGNRRSAKTARARYIAKFRKGLLNPPHGSTSTYANYGCRCPECRAVWSAKMKEYAARRKAQKAQAA